MRRMLGILTGLAFAGHAGCVRAQSIDYASLEALFGEPVTTGPPGSPQRASDVPVSMEIITAEDIRRSGAYDITDVLSHLSSVDVLQWTNDQTDVGLRGYNQALSSRLLVLVDGRQVYADFYGFTPWSTLPVELSAIRQIEVVKGPASALFGFNGVDGVINIVTTNPLYDDLNTVTVAGGTQSLAQGSAVVTFKAGGAAFRISGGGRSNDDFSTAVPLPNLLVQRPKDSRGALDFDAVIPIGDKTQFTFEASHSTTEQNEVNPIYSFMPASYTTNSVKGQLTSDTGLGLLKATAYSNWLKIDNTSVPLFNAFHFNNQVSVLQLEDVFKVGASHTFRLSAEYRYTTEETSPLGGADVSYKIATGGGMWEWKATPWLSVTNAVRLDHLQLNRSGFVPPGYPFTNSDWDRSRDVVSFNSGIVWHAGGLDTVRVTAARGTEVPNLNFIGGFLANTPIGGFSGVPTLKQTTVTNYEVDWDHQIGVLNGQVRMSVFSNKSRDLVTITGGFIPTSTLPYFTQINVGDSSARGVEVVASGKYGTQWHWSVGARYESIADHFTLPAQGGDEYIDFDRTTPFYQATANLGWSADRWEIDGFARFQSRSYGLRQSPEGVAHSILVRIPDRLSVDARIAYRIFDHLTFAVAGQNITQAVQMQTSGPEVERRVIGSLTYSW